MAIKKLFFSIFAVVMLALPLWFSQPAAALFQSSKTDACQGIALGNGSGCAASGGLTLSGVLSDVLNLLSVVVGVVALIMIIIGGLRYITSNGDSGNVQSARQTITYAVIGLIIVALSQALVQFVLNKATK